MCQLRDILLFPSLKDFPDCLRGNQFKSCLADFSRRVITLGAVSYSSLDTTCYAHDM